MSQPPLTYLEKKWGTGTLTGANTLFKGATQSQDREQVSRNDRDIHRNITPVGRRVMATLGNNVYANFGPVRNAINEIARHSVSTYLPQFKGLNSAWGEAAEEFLGESDQFIDIKGWPSNMGIFRRKFVVSIYRDGDVGIILADVDGKPKLQMIPSHRIGSRYNNETSVQTGPYTGLRIIDGMILDDYGATVAHRVYSENERDFQDISSNDMLLCYLPDYSDQVRGFSMLSAALFDHQDVADSRSYELMAEKLAAALPVIIKNETGMMDTSKQVLAGPSPAASASGAAEALPTQLVKPGTISYFRAGKGEGIEFPTSERPSANVMAFQAEVLRSAFASLGWNYDFTHDPTKAGGAQMRIVVEKINATVSELQSLVVTPMMRRTTGWRVSKAINDKFLPKETEWYKWGFQGPAEITADEKYSSDVAINKLHNGMASPVAVIESFGGNWEDVQDDLIEWRARLELKCKAKNIDPDTIVWPGPNGAPPEQPDQNEADPKAA